MAEQAHDEVTGTQSGREGDPVGGRGPLRRRRWRSAAVFALGAVVVCGAGAAVSWQQQADLRDLGSLQVVQAEVTGEDFRRRLPDLVEVSFEAGGAAVQASIPGDGDIEVGDSVEVAHVTDDPQRVRLVDGWEPPYTTWVELGVVGVVAGALVGLRGALRSGAHRAGGALRDRLTDAKDR